MSVSGENCADVVAANRRRAGRELVLELLFRPVSSALVPGLARLGVPPTAVVAANAASGLAAAVAIARGNLLVAALLLQLKTLLDNTDGRLARASGRVTLVGRYLDTEADLLVNVAVFGALGYVTGQPLVAPLALVALTLVLAVDFNLTELEREAREVPWAGPARTDGAVERLLARIYDVVFAPLDRLVRGLSERRFERLVPAGAPASRVGAARSAYRDRLMLDVLANLGLSTQLFVLGIFLAVGAPAVYPWLVLGCLLLLVTVQLRAERRALAVFAG
jgi:archaetidylinositol phosphate synthase